MTACVHCGAPNDEGAHFCASCGKPPSAALEEARKQEEARADEMRQKVGGWVLGVIILGTLGVALAAALEPLFEKKHDAHSAAKEDRSHGANTEGTETAQTATATTAAIPDPPVVVDPVSIAIPSCTCVARNGSSKSTFVLKGPAPIPIGDGTTWFFEWSEVTGPLTRNRRLVPTAGPAGVRGVLPPGPDVRQLRGAIGCDGNVVAFVASTTAGTTASAWAGTDGAPLWSVKLPAPLADGPDVPATLPMETTVSAACTQVLPVTAGLLTVKLANGSRIQLSMRDGTRH